MDKGDLANLIYMAVLSIAIIIYYVRKDREKKRAKTAPKPNINHDGNDFIDHLNQIAYFEFVSSDRLAELKEEIKSTYEHHAVLSSVESDEQPVCHRLFGADEEFLFEEGGIIETLKLLKAAFEVRGLRFDIDDHFEEYLENTGNQWVVINQHKYIIYQDLDGSKAEWSDATEALVALLNEELKLQDSDEKFYQINGGNDCQIVLLTLSQFEFLKASKIDTDWKPTLVKTNQ